MKQQLFIRYLLQAERQICQHPVLQRSARHLRGQEVRRRTLGGRARQEHQRQPQVNAKVSSEGKESWNSFKSKSLT